MYYVKTFCGSQLITETPVSCTQSDRADDIYDNAVKHAPHNGVNRVILNETMWGVTKILKDWYADDDQPEKWIVHSANTLDNKKTSTFNNLYATEEAALSAAKRCVKKWGNDHPGAYVFKAVKHVQREQAPIKVTDL